MPDRTQTLSLERYRHIPDLHDEPHAKLVPDPEGVWVRYTDVIGLFSQPEHQGDEDSKLRELADRIWEVAKGLGAGEPARELKEINQALYKRLQSQPPAPVLSDALEPFAAFAKNNVDEDAGWEEGACQGDRIVDWFGPSDFRAALDAFRKVAFLEHQGDEATVERLAQHLYEDAERTEEVAWPHWKDFDKKDGWLEKAREIVAVVGFQPPTPVLSEKERERLEQIANYLADSHDGSDPLAGSSIAFLRNLASLEHRGEECEACGRPGFGLRDMHGERFVLCPRCARDHGASPPPAGEVDNPRPGVGEHPDLDATTLAEMLWAFADHVAEIKVPEGYYPAWAGRLRAASLLLKSLLHRAQKAEAGEVEGLRERLGDDDSSNWLIGPGNDGARVLDGPAVGENIAVVPEHRLLGAEEVLLTIARARADDDEVLSAASPAYRLWDRVKLAQGYFEGRTVWLEQDSPPSDSQGDKERCGGSGFTKLGGAPSAVCQGCPDCNHTGPEGQECKHCDGTGTRSADLRGAVYDCPYCYGTGRRDRRGPRVNPERVEEERRYLPAPTQVEGDEPDENGVTEIDRAVVDDYARQLEGGDEEDWPAVTMIRAKGQTGAGNVFGGTLATASDWLRKNREFRRYVPASQDSSGLTKAKRNEGLFGGAPAVGALERAKKAEAERDQAEKERDEARCDSEEQREEKLRAETALEELAKELSERAEGYASETAINSAYRDAASLAREKAAELKEGER